MLEAFGSRFEQKADALGPFCLGLDPAPEILSAWGLPDTPSGVTQLCKWVADWSLDRVALVKPQIAYFERHGSLGIAALEASIAIFRARGTLVILDAKRGDIGSTSEAYGSAYFNPRSSLYVDAITAHPYLGFGSLRPILDSAARVGGAVFVVVASSNSEGIALQQARISEGTTIVRGLIQEIATYNVRAKGQFAGAVVGATRSDIDVADLQVLGPALVLCPGIGVQGADITNIAGWPNRRFIIPTASRSVLRCGRNRKAFLEALESNVVASKQLRQ